MSKAPSSTGSERAVGDFIFVGFNSRIAAIDRYTGDIVWEWKSPKGSGFVSLLLDGDRLVASVNGYMYCLDPVYGQQVWSNNMKGFGTGTTCLVSANGTSGSSAAAAVIRSRSDRLSSWRAYSRPSSARPNLARLNTYAPLT